MNWDDLRYLVAVQEHGSFSAAARALRVDQVTVGRRIAELQRSVGVPLVERTPAGTTLTAVGVRVAATARHMGDLADGIRRAAASAIDEVAGTVTITAPPTIVAHVLAPRVAELRRAHPHLQVVLSGSARTADLARMEADVAVRLQRPAGAALSARKVGALAYAVYAARKANAPFELLTYDETLAATPEMAWVREVLPDVPVALRTSSIDALLAAARAGAGMAVLPCFLAETDRALVRVADLPRPPARELWLVTHEEVRRSRRVRVGIDFVDRVLRDAREALRGP